MALKAKLSEEDICQIMALRDTGWSFGQLADKYNVSRQTISNTVRGFTVLRRKVAGMTVPVLHSLTDDDIGYIEASREFGRTFKAIGACLRTSPALVRYHYTTSTYVIQLRKDPVFKTLVEQGKIRLLQELAHTMQAEETADDLSR